MKEEWMPEDPCKDCTPAMKEKTVFRGCQGDWDCKYYGRYQCSVSSLDTVLRYLNKWIEDNSKFDIGLKLDSMIKELKENKNV